MSMGSGGIFGNPKKLGGLFGNRWGGMDESGAIPGFQVNMDGGPDAPEMAQAPQKAGFFGQGGVGRAIAGYLGDALLQQADMQPLYAPLMAQQRTEALRMKNKQAEREAEWQDFQRQYQFKRDNPMPANNDTLNDMNAAANWTPQQWEIYDKLHPIYKTGPDGMPYPVARSALTAPQAAPAGVTFTPIAGGAAPSAPPPFAGKPAKGFVPPATIPSGRMTSGRRTPEGNKLVGGVPNSKHLGPGAADYWGADLNAVLADVRKFPGFRRALIHNAGSGKHVHAEGEGWNTPYYGKRGTRGLGGK